MRKKKKLKFITVVVKVSFVLPFFLSVCSIVLLVRMKKYCILLLRRKRL